MKPAGSLNARRTKSAAPPTFGIAVVPSAYESDTITKIAPAISSTHGVNPAAYAATIPSAKKIDEPISPYATEAIEPPPSARVSPWKRRAIRASARGRAGPCRPR